MFKKLILVALLTLAPLPVFARNVNLDKWGTIQTSQAVEEEQLPLAKDLMIRQKRVFVEVNKKYNYSPFSIQLLSSFKTRIKVKWDDPNIVLRGEAKDSFLLKENTGRNIVFQAFKPTKGFFTITDEADNVLMEIPYLVQEQSTVKQRIGFNTGTSLKDFSPTANFSYSRHMRGTYSDDGDWSFNASVSTNLDDLDEIRVNLGVGYSW